MKKVLTKKKVCCSLEKDSIFSIKKRVTTQHPYRKLLVNKA